MADWRETTWGEEISLEYGKALRDYANTTGPYRVYGSNGPVGWTTGALAPGPGIILGRKGAYRGVRFSKEPFFVIDTAYYVVPKSDLDMRWLYYAIIYHKLGEIDDGSPIPSTTRSAVYVRTLSVPSLSEQKSIAAVLSALDEKIDLNRRMNETLEAMAGAIFKDWFIYFGPTRAKMEGREAYLAPDVWELFPERLDSDGKPEGWTKVRLSEVAVRITKGTTPTAEQIRAAPLSDQKINFVKVNALTDDGQILTAKLEQIPHCVHAGALRRSALQSEDILYSIAGTIGRVAFVEEQLLPANTNQALAIIRPNTARIPSRFLVTLLRQREFVDALHVNIVHAVQANLSLSMISNAQIILPSEKMMAKGFPTLEAIIKKQEANNREVRTLAALRDLVLPKLMSGKIRVNEADKVMEAVL